MKTLLVLALLLIGGGVLLHKHPPSREAARAFIASADEKKRLATYQQGKSLLLSKWAPAPTAIFPAWGDGDELAHVTPMENGIWEAGGSVIYTANGTPQQRPWRVVFNPTTNEVFARLVGDDAGASITEIARTLPLPPAPGKPTPPKPGDWLFKSRNALDRRPSDRR